MHAILIIGGLILVFMIVVHIVFRVIKFTIMTFLLGVALVAVLYFFKQYLGIDLIGELAAHLH
jgi:hypothetical protein